MKLQVRGGIAAILVAGAALVAAGCGGSDSGSTGAAKDAAALDFVPKDAIAYVTIDTDFSGDQWTQVSDLAKAFDAEFKPVDEQIAEAAAKGEDKVDFEQDVEPWLGDSAGAAITGLPKSDDADVFVWVEVKDRAKLEAFAKDEQDLVKGETVGDFTIWASEDDRTVVGISDDLAIFTDSSELLVNIVEYDGDSVADAEGVSDAIDGVEGDALATVVVNGAGIRAAAKSSDQLKSLADAEQLKDFEAMAMSLSAEDEGFRIDGHAVSSGDSESENVEHPIFEELPANTVLAIGGDDLGGALNTIVEEAGKSNADVQQGVGAVTAVLGVTTDDLAEAMSGEFVLALGADDAGLGAIAGGVAGAAMGGGLEGTDPSQLLRAATLVLAFEETGETAETIDKVAGAAGTLLGGAAGTAPKAGEAGDFTVKRLEVQGFPVTTAATDDVAAIALGADVFTAWGDEPLSDDEAFTGAWEAAGAPNESVGVIWLNAGRIARLAGMEGAEGTELGGMVGWIEADGSNADFGAFLHVDEG